MVLVPRRGLGLEGEVLIGFVRKSSSSAIRPPEGQVDGDTTSASSDPHSADEKATGFLNRVRQLFKRRGACAECGQPVKEPFDLEAAQRAASEFMAKNPGHRIDIREPVPLCETCQTAWDEAAKEFFGPSGRITIS